MKKIISLLILIPVLFSQMNDSYKQAEKLYENKSYEKALDLLDNLIDDNDELAKYHYLSAKCFYEMKEFEDAVDFMEEAIELEANNIAYLKFYNETMIKYSDDVGFLSMISFVKKMRTNWENILKLEIDNKEMMRLLARYYLFAPALIGKDYELGKRYVDMIRKIDSNLADEIMVDYYLKEEKDEAKALAILDANKDQNSFFILKTRMSLYQSNNELHKLNHTFNQLHGTYYKTENIKGLYNQYGYYLIAQKSFNEAIRVLTFMKEKAPNEANSYDSLGDAYKANGQIDKAKENYRKAIEIDPAFEASINNLKELN